MVGEALWWMMRKDEVDLGTLEAGGTFAKTMSVEVGAGQTSLHRLRTTLEMTLAGRVVLMMLDSSISDRALPNPQLRRMQCTTELLPDSSLERSCMVTSHISPIATINHPACISRTRAWSLPLHRYSHSLRSSNCEGGILPDLPREGISPSGVRGSSSSSSSGNTGSDRQSLVFRLPNSIQLSIRTWSMRSQGSFA